MTLVSGINFLNQAFHLAAHALAGFPKLHHKCSAHSEFRIWLVSASVRGYSVEFTWILCRRWKTDAVADDRAAAKIGIAARWLASLPSTTVL